MAGEFLPDCTFPIGLLKNAIKLTQLHPDAEGQLVLAAQMFLGHSADETWTFSDRLDSDWKGSARRELLESEGASLPELPPCSALLLEISS